MPLHISAGRAYLGVVDWTTTQFVESVADFVAILLTNLQYMNNGCTPDLIYGYVSDHDSVSLRQVQNSSTRQFC